MTGGATNYWTCAYLAVGVMITYFERNGFAVAMTVASDLHSYPQYVKGNVMSLFFVTYASTHLAGGALARRYGGLLVLRRMTACWLAFSLVCPFSTETLPLLRLCRLGIGLSQGLIFPSVHTLLSQMTTPSTRGHVVSVCISAIYLGSAVSTVTSPAIVSNYGPAAQTTAAALCAAAWLALSPLVSWPDEEVRVLSLASSARAGGGGGGACSWAADVPWLAMATHPAVLVMMFASFSFHVVAFFVMHWTPTFVTHVLGEELRQSTAVQALPWMLMYVVAVASGTMSDFAGARLGIRQARKLVCAVGLFAAAPMLLLLPGARSSSELYAINALVLMTSGFSRGGFSINHLDIGPAYAGVLQGYAGTMGNLAGIAATRVPGALLSLDPSDRAVWSTMASGLALLSVAAGVLFVAFAEGEVIFREHPKLYGSEGSDDAAAEREMEGVEMAEIGGLYGAAGKGAGGRSPGAADDESYSDTASVESVNLLRGRN